MHALAIALGIFVAICLIHYSYVDFRFRHVDGILWFWLASPVGPLLWASRIAIGVAIVVGLATVFTGANRFVLGLLVVLFAIHIGTLIAIEIRHGR
jgi:ABC-type uncharacterized transport system permease subunit